MQFHGFLREWNEREADVPLTEIILPAVPAQVSIPALALV